MKIRLIFLIIIFASFFMTHVGTAQEIKLPVLIPIGGGELDVYSELTYELVDLTKDGDIHIFLLPVGFSKSEQYILSDLQEIIQTACQNALIAENGTRKCMVSLAPDVNSTNVDDLEISQEITNELSAIIILSPSSDLTMNILHGTMVERSLEDAYHHGVIIVGSSEAGNLLSRTMLVDYADGFSAENALQFGAVEVWGDDLRRGLEFGNPLSIIDTHIFQDGHLTRLINAIALPDVPHIGIGVDAFSGVMVQNQEELKNAFGSYDVVIIDAETYQAANGVEYRGTNNLISLRNVLVHKISSGESTYNLRTRELSLAPPHDELIRKDVIPPISDQAGVLILNGGFNSQYTAIRPLERFENLAGGQEAKIHIVASGYGSDREARTAVEQLEEILNVSTTVSILSGGEESTLEIPEDTTGVLMIGNDPSLVQMEKLTKIRELWEQGLPLMAIDAAASVVGAFYTAHEPIPENETDAEALSQESMKQGTAHINTGLGLIDASIEPRFLQNNRWGSLFTLAFNHPELVTLGLNQDTTLYIESETVMIEGDNGVISLDLRNADIAPGANGGYIFANGLIDIFSPGEILRFQNAKSGDTFIHAATPLIPSSTPTNTRIITSTTTPKPTRTPRPPRQSRNDILDTPTRKPTRTPIPTPFIPPPTDTNLTSAIIIVGVFAVIAVFLGYWLNRRYL